VKAVSQVFSGQEILFDLSPFLSYDIQLIVHTWCSPRPLNWCSKVDGTILAEGQFLEAPGLPLFTLESESGRRVSDGIPEPVLNVARLMPAIDFELAQACAASNAAIELAETSSLLFILLVNYCKNQSLSLNEFEYLLSLKRIALLEKVGLPESKSLVKLMNRIELSPLLPWELEDVVQMLRHKEFVKLLRHHPNIHLNHLRLLRLHPQPLWPGMLSLVDSHSSALDIGWICRMTRDTLAMTNGNAQPLSRVNSQPALQQLHDRLVREFNSGVREDQAKILLQKHGKYPSPPVPTLDGIEPITSWLELLEEGAIMRHCVGSYDRQVAEGEVFIYRMVYPERLTVSLIYRNNRWMVGEARRRRNGNPSPKVMEFIRRWVERD